MNVINVHGEKVKMTPIPFIFPGSLLVKSYYLSVLINMIQ